MTPILFYAVCVPVRFLLALAVIFAGRKYPKPTAAVVISAVVVGFALMYINSVTRRPNAWWSRTIHSMFMIMIAIAAIFVLLDVGKVKAEYLGFIILADLAFGISHSILRNLEA